jgi:Ras-related protein Rap-1B
MRMSDKNMTGLWTDTWLSGATRCVGDVSQNKRARAKYPKFVAMRDLYMKTGQGFVLVFSITSASSLGEIATLREEIIRIKDDTSVPMVMVGNKCDLEEHRAIPRARAFSISQQWAIPYYEASARTRTNVEETFIDLCRQMLRQDDDFDAFDELEAGSKFDAPSRAHRRRRSKMKNKDLRCTIL